MVPGLWKGEYPDDLVDRYAGYPYPGGDDFEGKKS